MGELWRVEGGRECMPNRDTRDANEQNIDSSLLNTSCPASASVFTRWRVLNLYEPQTNLKLLPANHRSISRNLLQSWTQAQGRGA
jgi:hypothetical protein